MAVDEPLLTLGQAARLLPKRRGRYLTARTLYRWARDGHRGVKLKVCRFPDRVATKRSWVEEFGRALALLEGHADPHAPPPPGADAEWAKAVLRSMRLPVGPGG